MEQPFDHVHFVVNWQLDGQPGQLAETAGGRQRPMFVFLIKNQHQIAMTSITTKQSQRPVVQNEPNDLIPFHSLFPVESREARDCTPARRRSLSFEAFKMTVFRKRSSSNSESAFLRPPLIRASPRHEAQKNRD